MARLKQDRFFSEKPLRLRSPRESLGGYILLHRLMDKVRLLAKGQIPPSYVQNVLGDKTTLDGRFLLFTDLEPAALRGVILSTHSDEEVLAWIQDHATPTSVSEQQTWAEQIQRERPDPARVEYRKRTYPHLAGRIDLSLARVLDLIDIDEGRLRVLPEP